MINLDVKIRHRNWEEALNMLFALLISATPGEVVTITGPSRSGKTRMIEELLALLNGPDFGADSDEIAAAYVLVDNDSNGGKFSTKSFIWDALVAIKHVDYYGVVDAESIRRKLDRTSEAAMKKSFESGAEKRKTKYLFFDEVQHVKYVYRRVDVSHMVLDSWKNMAKKAGVVLVLAGAYPMLDTLRKSPHLVGRQYKVQLPRYYDTDEDLNEFASIVSQYMARLPSELIDEDLVGYTRYLHAYSYGCIGLLQHWLVYAAVYAKVHRQTIDQEILELTRLTDDDLVSIGDEISAGEDILLRDSEFLATPRLTKEESSPDVSGKAVKKSNIRPFKAAPRRYKPDDRNSD